MEEQKEYQNLADKILCENGYDGTIIFSDPSYDTAFIGITPDNRAVYDYELMVDFLINDPDYQMDEEEAADFISYNDSFSQGGGYPAIWYGDEIFELEEDEEPLKFTRLVAETE